MPKHYCGACFRTFADPRLACPSCQTGRPETGWAEVLEPGDLLDRHYRIHSVLAVAGAGLTYRAREVDGSGKTIGPELAIKVLYAEHAERQLQRLSTEAQILQALHHDNLVELRGFVNRSGSLPYLVTLFEHGGHLGQHLATHGALSPRVSAGIIVQLLRALEVTHERGIVHRDLKPDNLLLRAPTAAHEVPHLRVADFGIAKVKGGPGVDTVQGAFVGTPEYAAPEQFHSRTPTAATDVFAAGCLLVECLTGHPPLSFENRNDLEACHTAWASLLPYEPEFNGPEALRQIVRSMLAPAPADRPEISALLSCLQPLADGGEAISPLAPAAPTAPPSPAQHTRLAGVGVFTLVSLLGTAAVCLALLAGSAWAFGYFEAPGLVIIPLPSRVP